MTRGLAWMALLTLPSTLVAAQSPDHRLGRLAPEVRTAITAVLDSAARLGLPSEPLIEKALEGSAKGASPAAIASAVRSLSAALASAQASLGPRASPDEVDAGAVALRLGVRPEAISRLRAARGRESLVVPLGLLSDLVARGVPPDTAADVVVALASRSDDEYLAFRRRVDHDIQLGAPPVGSVMGAFSPAGRPAQKP